jgi:hypothetical protein
MTDAQGFAVLAARIAGIDTNRIRDWTDHHDGTVTRALVDGTLHYNANTRTLRWQATCRMGAVHTYLIDTPGLAAAARMRAATCTQLHADLTGIEPLTTDEMAELGVLNVQSRTAPRWAKTSEPEFTESKVVQVVVRSRVLGDQLTHAHSATDDTQPIAALPAADQDQPKEHPQP